jgi:hypothetical protein
MDGQRVSCARRMLDEDIYNGNRHAPPGPGSSHASFLLTNNMHLQASLHPYAPLTGGGGAYHDQYGAASHMMSTDHMHALHHQSKPHATHKDIFIVIFAIEFKHNVFCQQQLKVYLIQFHSLRFLCII